MSIAKGDSFYIDHPPLFITKDDFDGIEPHEDDPMVITIATTDYRVKRVLIDQGSSSDVLFWETFKRLGLDAEQIKLFNGSLVGFSGEQVEVRGYVELKTTIGEGRNAKTLRVRYMLVKARSSYNIILGRSSLNKLGAVVSTLHLTMRYPLEGVESVSLKRIRGHLDVVIRMHSNHQGAIVLQYRGRTELILWTWILEWKCRTEGHDRWRRLRTSK